MGIEVAGGFRGHDTDSPRVIQCPVGTQQQALAFVFHPGAAALFVEAAAVAQALHPDVAFVVGGQRAQGREQLVAQVLRGVVRCRGKVGVLAAGQLLKACADPSGLFAQCIAEFFQGFDLLGVQFSGLQ